MRIIPIASGKGGVGKTLIAANLSIALAKLGRRVVIVDLDLGASNLHLMLGAKSGGKGVGAFLSGTSCPFEEIVSPTDIEGLSFIAGDGEIPGLANIRAGQKNKLIRRLLSLEADYLVMDLGAGTNSNILDFFLMSGQGIVVATPTLAATLNAYLFLKNAAFRLMAAGFLPRSKARAYLDSLGKEGLSLQKAYIPSILDQVKRIDKKSYAAFRVKAERFRPRIIMNMLSDPKDADRAQKIRRSCEEYLGLELEHLGVVYQDEFQEAALSSRLPIIIYKPQSVLSQAIYRIADKIISAESEPDAGPLQAEDLEGGFREAELEAEADFTAKLESLEDLLHCGALSTGDLVETVKSQQYEITQLKRENLVLKRKLGEAIRNGYLQP